MTKNFDVLGVAALLLLAAYGRGNEHNATTSFKGGILPSLKVDSVLSDFHRLTRIMNRMDSLGRMAFKPDEDYDFLSRLKGDKPQLDLDSIAEAMAPLISSMGLDSMLDKLK